HVTFTNTAFAFAINDDWVQQEQGNFNPTPGPGSLVFSDIKISNVAGSQLVDPSHKRAAVSFNCIWSNSCTGITFNNVNIWSSDGSLMTAECRNAVGTGYCLDSPGAGSEKLITQLFNGKAVPVPTNDPFTGPFTR
ncbi:hypothetical protein BDK51DRAFT_31151, partial [Blyttiomyces helicus]